MSGAAHADAHAAPGRGLKPPAAAALNHLLKSASWARERLRPFAGKIARFELAPFTVTVVILGSGEVADAPAPAVPDAGFTLTPGVALRTLAGDADAWQKVAATGDAALAREILYIAQNLRWDVEEDLSRVFGDIAAHRMVAGAASLMRWQRDTAAGFARAAAAYWTDERPLVAARHDVERFTNEVDSLRDDVARLEKRIEQLAGRAAKPVTQ
ncbi:MAG: SCP2 sterol-binding domain-containing protein [Burkholderiales bacterium]